MMHGRANWVNIVDSFDFPQGFLWQICVCKIRGAFWLRLAEVMMVGFKRK